LRGAYGGVALYRSTILRYCFVLKRLWAEPWLVRPGLYNTFNLNKL
jgi:hypothetical protein